jgi:Fe-S cluster biogenesis protein NfuA
MPEYLRREPTPNPNAFKLISSEVLLEKGSISFATAEEAAQHPTAKAFFDLGSVDAVLIAENFVSVSANEWANWSEIESVAKEQFPIFDTTKAVQLAEEASRAKQEEQVSREPNELLDKVNELIDTYVRPALAGDGGGLEVVDMEEKTIRVRYQGACGSCPSATAGTLAAIESMLRNKIDPELSVESVA